LIRRRGKLEKKGGALQSISTLSRTLIEKEREGSQGEKGDRKRKEGGGEGGVLSLLSLSPLLPTLMWGKAKGGIPRGEKEKPPPLSFLFSEIVHSMVRGPKEGGGERRKHRRTSSTNIFPDRG